MKFSSMLSSGISSKVWRLGGRLLLYTRESLVRQLFTEGRTYGTIGTRSSATACRGQQVSLVQYMTVSSVAL
jgi:hypothetical protein